MELERSSGNSYGATGQYTKQGESPCARFLRPADSRLMNDSLLRSKSTIFRATRRGPMPWNFFRGCGFILIGWTLPDGNKRAGGLQIWFDLSGSQIEQGGSKCAIYVIWLCWGFWCCH